MAQKRMFDKAIIDTDRFMDLSMSSKALYFLLGMEADDEGFVSYRKVMRIHGGNEDDIKVLLAKNFLIGFKSGVVVITDWCKNNWLDKRRIKPTEYKIEKKLLALSSTKEYVLSGCLASAKPEECSIEEYRVEECSIEEKKKKKKNRFSRPSLQDVSNYIIEKGYNVDAEAWIAFYESNGWKVGKNPMKSWKGAVTTWEKRNPKKDPHITEVIMAYLGKNEKGTFNEDRISYKQYNLYTILTDINDFEDGQQNLYQKMTHEFLRDKETINYLKKHPYVQSK